MRCFEKNESAKRRIFLIILDSVGIGAAPDAEKYGDAGSHTLASCFRSGRLDIPNLQKLGIYNIDGIACGERIAAPIGSFGKMTEVSAGKDTTIGHWEIAGIISSRPLPTYPNGFPEGVIAAFKKATGRGVLCNKPYSGTDVIIGYGQRQIETGDLIVYTSADSVFQIAAHEDVVPVEQLYKYCEAAREILRGENAVGRVIARPFAGSYPDFKRTANRHDFSLQPPSATMLTELSSCDFDVIAIGKINDIFAGQGITEAKPTKDNDDGMKKTMEYLDRDFNGLCFVNLVDFDMLYGHRNDIPGYTGALNRFDTQLGEFIAEMRDNDILMLAADHGCDPGTASTDHSREYAPWLIYGGDIKRGVNLGICSSFADIGKTISDILGASADIAGQSHKKSVLKRQNRDM